MRAIDDYEGMILYTIERNGCLNGVFTHRRAGGLISNEIARKIGEKDDGSISGTYHCTWMEKMAHTGTLLISPKNEPDGYYEFEWWEDNNVNPVFIGVGYHMNDKQIAVSVWEP